MDRRFRRAPRARRRPRRALGRSCPRRRDALRPAARASTSVDDAEARTSRRWSAASASPPRPLCYASPHKIAALLRAKQPSTRCARSMIHGRPAPARARRRCRLHRYRRDHGRGTSANVEQRRGDRFALRPLFRSDPGIGAFGVDEGHDRQPQMRRRAWPAGSPCDSPPGEAMPKLRRTFSLVSRPFS